MEQSGTKFTHPALQRFIWDASSKIKYLQLILQLCGSGKAKANTFLQAPLFQLQDARNKWEVCQSRLCVTSDLEMSTGETHILHPIM